MALESWGGRLAGYPAAVSWGPDRLDVFGVEDGTHHLLHWWRDGINWSGPQDLGGNLPAEGVSAASWGPNRLDIFAAGPGNQLWHWWWDGANWGGPQPLGGNLPAEGVSAVSWGPNRLDIFAAGAGNQLWHWWWDGANWGGPQPLGGNLPAEGVSAVSWGPNRLDVFAADKDLNRLKHWAWDGVQWITEDLGGNLAAEGVSAVSAGPDQLDVFAVGHGTNDLLHWSWDGVQWNGPRSRGNLPEGDVSGVRSGPNHLDVFAIGWDKTLQHWPGVQGLPLQTFTNWAGNQSIQPLQLLEPSSVEELVAIVQDAESKGLHVRAVGSGWSFSDIALTPDYLVKTEQLNSAITKVTDTALNANGKARTLFHVEAGITLRDLCVRLDGLGLALQTLGGSAGQTLAGAISTAVHGGDFRIPPLPDMVQAIHLVGPGGAQHWIERSTPITDVAKLQAALQIDPMNIHYDDKWFYSVLVSMGCMGIIYSLVIEVRPQFGLLETLRSYNWSDVRAALQNGRAFDGAFTPDQVPSTSPPLRFLQIVINPYRNQNNDHTCYVTARWEIPVPSPLPRNEIRSNFLAFLSAPAAVPEILNALAAALPAALAALPLVPVLVAALPHNRPPTPGDILVALLNFATNNSHPELVPFVEEVILNNMLAPHQSQDLGYLVMAGSSDQTLYIGGGLEVAFDAFANGYLGFVDEAFSIADQALKIGKAAAGGIFALRFTGSSGAYLAMEQWTRNCFVEVDLLRDLKGNVACLQRLERAAFRHGGILHWGQQLDHLTDAEGAVAKAYPHIQDWRSVRSALTKGGQIRTFDNTFSWRCGLSV